MTERRPVVVYRARNHFEARILQGLLETEGLTPVIPDALLADEVGASRMLAGTSACEVFVPAEQADLARDIVAAWEERAEG